MKKISLEKRKAALRLLELWVLMKTFLESCSEKSERIHNSLENPQVDQCIGDYIAFSATGENLFTNSFIALEELDKKKTLAEQYDKYMRAAWKKLQPRDRTVLSVYTAEGDNHLRPKDAVQQIGISWQRFSQCRDIALARLWGVFEKKKPCSHRTLSRLIYQWSELSGYSTQGNRRDWTGDALEKLRVRSSGIRVRIMITI